MPGRSQKNKYGEFRVFVEWRRRGKWAIRPEFVPSLAAWLLMIGRRYEKMASGMRDRNMVATVPGLEESARTLDVCIANVQRLLNELTNNFDNQDWQESVAEICRLMKITPTSTPYEEVPPGQFEHMISEPTPDAPIASGSGPTVHMGASDEPTGPREQPNAGRKRRRSGGKRV